MVAPTRSSASSTRLAGKGVANPLVLAGGQDERERRRAVPQVYPCELAGGVEVAGAVQDVVGDLEGDAESETELAEPGPSAAQSARDLEQLPGLERAAEEVVVDGGVGAERLAALQRLPAGEREGRVGEQRDRRGVLRGGELREGSRKQVIARRFRRLLPVERPGGRTAATQICAVEHVVVNERRHVNQLDGCSGGDHRVSAPFLRRRREKHEHGAQPLAAGRERLRAHLGHEPRVRGDARLEARLEPLEVALEAGRRAYGCDRVHRPPGRRASDTAVAVCRATIPPPSNLQRICPNPAPAHSAASSRGSGNRLTLAGRYA